FSVFLCFFFPPHAYPAFDLLGLGGVLLAGGLGTERQHSVLEWYLPPCFLFCFYERMLSRLLRGSPELKKTSSFVQVRTGFFLEGLGSVDGTNHSLLCLTSPVGSLL